ncbi:hypothetical protein [Sporocytophaga myxococcoides]|uniref:hypothetical protein n=1 Tax=Sporocytophaga myxococcoides TaxID=153721 RepID=UPI0012DD9D3C|nr:hypothetical protein [Sporocytophaga myxococcoides]
MRPIKYVCLCIGSMILLMSAIATDPCIALLEHVFDKMNTKTLPETKKVYLFEYNVKTVLKDKSYHNGVISSDIRLVAGTNYTEVISKDMEVYQDEVQCYSVIPSRKVIYLSDSQLNKKPSAEDQQNFAGLQKIILEKAKVKECKDVEDKEHRFDKEIHLELDPRISKELNMNRVDFLVDSKNEKVYQTNIFYPSNHKFQSVLLTYRNIDFNHKGQASVKPFKNKFLNADGTLKPAFKGYKLVDVRANKK